MSSEGYKVNKLIIREWDKLPPEMQTPEVRPYWEQLYRKRNQLIAKRCIDAALSAAGLVALGLPMIAIAAYIRIDSPGPVFFRQVRVTVYGKRFRIHKFRTMTADTGRHGSSVTALGDERITRAGAVLRRLKLDELPQLIDVLAGDMSLVGVRPEAECYVERYEPEYMATLLLPAGITSEATLEFINEEDLLARAEDIDEYYMNVILPEKMKHNLSALMNFSIGNDAMTLARTIRAVLPSRRSGLFAGRIRERGSQADG